MDTRLKIWSKKSFPKKILAIRMHAMGDVIITLPYLQYLRNSLPAETKIDFLTISESETIPKNIYLFNHVYAIKGGRVLKKQFLFACLLLPELFLRRYDIIIDLQDGIISRLITKLLAPKSLATFDRISPIAAGERTRLTIESIGLGTNTACNIFKLKDSLNIEKLLIENGYNPHCDLIVLNPAGAFETRNWPLINYVAFAKLWLQKFPETQFLVIGINTIESKAEYFKKELGDKLINLVNKTSPAQAFAIIQRIQFILSEDSGLMHMAWVSGIPTLALFGSTRSDWSRPLGDHTFLFHSSDLECGNCMLEFCKYGDTHCLTRYTPETIFEKAVSLLNK